MICCPLSSSGHHEFAIIKNRRRGVAGKWQSGILPTPLPASSPIPRDLIRRLGRCQVTGLDLCAIAPTTGELGARVEHFPACRACADIVADQDCPILVRITTIAVTQQSIRSTWASQLSVVAVVGPRHSARRSRWRRQARGAYYGSRHPETDDANKILASRLILEAIHQEKTPTTWTPATRQLHVQNGLQEKVECTGKVGFFVANVR